MFEAEIRCLSVVTTSLVSVVASFVRPSSKQYSKPCTFVVLERLTGSRLSPVPFSCHRKAVECPVSLRSLEENSAVRLNILKQTCQVFCLRVSGALFGAAFYHLAPCAPLSHSWTDMVFWVSEPVKLLIRPFYIFCCTLRYLQLVPAVFLYKWDVIAPSI